MPWVVLQMCMISSQASTFWYRFSTLPLRSALLAPSTAEAGRDSSTVGVEISVTFRHLV